MKQRGFSLIEVAIGLMVIGLVAAGLIASISQQNEQRRIAETKATINQARDAVMAFLGSQGRLPCPASNASNGQEAILSNIGGVITCSLEAGYLPAVTLGLPGVNGQGLLNNAWGDIGAAGGIWPRALRYAVPNLAAPVANALTSPGLGAPGSSTRRNDVQTSVNNGNAWFVCASVIGAGAGANRCGNNVNLLAANAAVVIWTLGANGNDAAAFSADEQQNANLGLQRVFISRGFAPAGAIGGMYDDLSTWISVPLVLDRLMASGAVQ